jgi:hypothetical protein
MTKHPFVPVDFEVPAGLETEQFRLRMLTVHDVDKDYEAVMETRERLSAFSGYWPREGFTIEENLADLQRHQREHLERIQFTYTVVAPDESRVLGCLYIQPDKKGTADARVYMWVRESEYQKGLDPVLFETVKDWLGSDWPFKMVVYPGR